MRHVMVNFAIPSSRSDHESADRRSLATAKLEFPRLSAKVPDDGTQLYLRLLGYVRPYWRVFACPSSAADLGGD